MIQYSRLSKAHTTPLTCNFDRWNVRRVHDRTQNVIHVRDSRAIRIMKASIFLYVCLSVGPLEACRCCPCNFMLSRPAAMLGPTDHYVISLIPQPSLPQPPRPPSRRAVHGASFTKEISFKPLAGINTVALTPTPSPSHPPTHTFLASRDSVSQGGNQRWVLGSSMCWQRCHARRSTYSRV